MLCAAAEQPLGGPRDDASLFGGQQAFDEAVRALCAEEKLVLLPGGPHHAPSWRADVLNGTAAELCNIRSIERHKVQVVLRRRVRNAQPTLPQCAARGGGEAAGSGSGAGGGAAGAAGTAGTAGAGDDDEEEEEEEVVVIDEVERWRVYYEFFPGAVYLNQGRTYVTQSLDLRADGGTVRVAAANLKYYTAALDSTQVHVLQRLAESRLQLGSSSSGVGDGGGDDGSGGDGGGDDSGGGGGSGGVGGSGDDGGDGGGGGDGNGNGDGGSGGDSNGGDGGSGGDDGGDDDGDGSDANGGDCGGGGDDDDDDDDDIWESDEPAAVPPPAKAATRLAGACAHLGRVRVTLQTEGFRKIWHKTGEIFEEAHAPFAATHASRYHRTPTRQPCPNPHCNPNPIQVPLSLPPHAYETRASWVDLPAGCADALAEAGLGEQLEAGLHAAAHALLAVLPLHLSCEPGDVGCECNALRKASQLRRGGPQRLLLFDRCTCMLCARCVHGVCMVCAWRVYSMLAATPQ